MYWLNSWRVNLNWPHPTDLQYDRLWQYFIYAAIFLLYIKCLWWEGHQNLQWTAQMSVSPPVQSIIHHSSAPDLIIKIHTFTHNPPTHRPIGFHFLPSGMSVTSTDTPDEALQATARRSFYLKHVFLSPLFFTASAVFTAARHGQIDSYQTWCPRLPHKDQIPADSWSSLWHIIARRCFNPS